MMLTLQITIFRYGHSKKSRVPAGSIGIEMKFFNNKRELKRKSAMSCPFLNDQACNLAQAQKDGSPTLNGLVHEIHNEEYRGQLF